MAQSWKLFRRSERFHSSSCQASHPLVPFFSRATDDGGQEAQVVCGLYFDSFAIGVQPPKFILSLFNCLFDWLTACSVWYSAGSPGFHGNFFLTTDVLRYVFSTPWCRCSGPWPCWSQWHMCDLVLVKLGTRGHGCWWKVEGDFGSEIRFLQFSAFACACTCSCVPFSNHPLVYPLCVICARIQYYKYHHVDCVGIRIYDVYAHPVTSIFLSIYHRHQKNISPHPNICRHRTSNESIFKKSCMHFSLAIFPFIHLWQPMESPSTMSQTEVCHFDCSGSGNVPKRSWRLKWEPPGITCKVSINWYLSWREWIMHDHFDMNLIFATCQTCLNGVKKEIACFRHVWLIVYSESIQKGPSIRRCECFHNGLQSAGSIHHTHETNAWTWKCFPSPESPLQTRALLCLYFPAPRHLRWLRDPNPLNPTSVTVLQGGRPKGYP